MQARRFLPVGAALALILGLAFNAFSSSDGSQTQPPALTTSPIPLRANPAIGPFQGLGTWVDIYDAAAWQRPRQTVRKMSQHGVRTLYLETSNYRHGSAFVHRTRTIHFLDAAARFHVKVIAWYLPAFRDVAQDVRRIRAAIQLTTPSGNAFDGFGLDIEASIVRDPSARTDRVLRETDRIRAIGGNTYPLAAIIPAPKRLLITDPTYWPHFPFGQLAAKYDAILPMTYFSYTTSGKDAAHRFTAQAIDLIRREVGNDQVPIHVIGGLAQVANDHETQGFVQAIREHGIIGASYYTFPGITSGQWRELEKIPPNPVEAPAAPLPVGPTAVGNITGDDQTHPKEAVYQVGKRAGAWKLSYEAFDAQSSEVKIFVNWHLVGSVPSGPDADWSTSRTVRLPAKFLKDAAQNYVAFVASGDDPHWSVWGVRNLSIAQA